MPDDFEQRLRAALRHEAERLPFLVEADAVEAALHRPARRSSPWLAAAVIPLAAVVLLLALLWDPTDDPTGSGTAFPDPCNVSPVVTHDWYEEAGGPNAFFAVDSRFERTAGHWLQLVRFVPTPGEDAALTVWATNAQSGVRIDAEVEPGGGIRPQRFDQPFPDLPGSVYLAQPRIPSAGCWTLHAAVDGREVGSATIVVGPEPVVDNQGSPAPSPRLASEPLGDLAPTADCDVARARTIDPDEIGGPRAFFDVTDLHARGRPAGTIRVRVDPPLDGDLIRIEGLIVQTDAESYQLDTYTGNLVQIPPEDLPADALPGTHLRGDLFIDTPGCWQIRALLHGQIIGSGVVILD